MATCPSRIFTTIASGVENAQALEDIIGDGITEAPHAKDGIDVSTARTIANALGDAPALDRFAATGEGDRLAIEQEYFELFENPTTPDIVRDWINWLVGDRQHYLKGTVHCGSCGSRLMVNKAHSRASVIYDYFVCIGRHQRRTNCTRSAMPIEQVEKLVERA